MIQQEQAAGGLSVTASCEALAVSVSGYYAARRRRVGSRQQVDEILGAAVEQIFK